MFGIYFPILPLFERREWREWDGLTTPETYIVSIDIASWSTCSWPVGFLWNLECHIYICRGAPRMITDGGVRSRETRDEHRTMLWSPLYVSSHNSNNNNNNINLHHARRYGTTTRYHPPSGGNRHITGKPRCGSDDLITGRGSLVSLRFWRIIANLNLYYASYFS